MTYGYAMKGTQRSEHEYKQHSPACDDARIKLNKSGCRQYFDEHLWLPINGAPDFDCMQFMEMHAPHVACTNNADELKRLYLHDTPMRHSLSEKLSRHRSCFGFCRHAQTHFFTFVLSVTVQPLCAYFALFSFVSHLEAIAENIAESEQLEALRERVWQIESEEHAQPVLLNSPEAHSIREMGRHKVESP